jgi:hypothetical protein
VAFQALVRYCLANPPIDLAHLLKKDASELAMLAVLRPEFAVHAFVAVVVASHVVAKINFLIIEKIFFAKFFNSLLSQHLILTL